MNKNNTNSQRLILFSLPVYLVRKSITDLYFWELRFCNNDLMLRSLCFADKSACFDSILTSRSSNQTKDFIIVNSGNGKYSFSQFCNEGKSLASSLCYDTYTDVMVAIFRTKAIITLAPMVDTTVVENNYLNVCPAEDAMERKVVKAMENRCNIKQHIALDSYVRTVTNMTIISRTREFVHQILSYVGLI